MQLLRLDLSRSDVVVSDVDVAAVVRGDTALGLDLLRVIASDRNLMVSPYSVGVSLSMLYTGTRGLTASEIADVAHFDVEDSTLHAVRNFLDSQLDATLQPRAGDDRELFAIRPANSVWGQGGYPFLDDYLSVLATYYGAGLRLVDFSSDPRSATDAINEWTEDATEGRISDLLPPDVIDETTRMVLVNAIWFKANWASNFDPENTTEGPFTLIDGTHVPVPLMHSNLRTGYTEPDLFQAVRLPYAGNAEMVVALPKGGTPADLVAALTPDDLNIEWGDFIVDLTMPRFQFETEVALKDALQALGIEAAFVKPQTGADNTADLTGLTTTRELYVSKALHKTVIALDENGTEAAAATAQIMGVMSLPQPATFTADRPFLFWIVHTPTNEVLFLGQVTNPANT
jgi:serpin B